MNIEIKYTCPDCGVFSKKDGTVFKNIKSLSQHHNRYCKNKKELYYFDESGPINIKEFFKGYSSDYIKLLYPNLISNYSIIRKSLKNRNIIIPYSNISYTKEELLEKIKHFYRVNKRVPTAKDFTYSNSYPSYKTYYANFGSWNTAIELSGLEITQKSPQNYTKEEIINFIKLFVEKETRIPSTRDWDIKSKYTNTKYVINLFGSWNNAIEAAGFMPNNNNGYGTRSIAKDGILYRSSKEAEFVNKFLYEKEVYEYETKYPKPYNKYYDFYLPKRNLYIEIDGGLRPHVMLEKIEINKKLGRNLLIIPIKNVSNFKGFI